MSQLRKYAFIDALRGWAIVGVVMVHATLIERPGSGMLAAIAGQGQSGVQLFFVASALTLFLSMRSRVPEECSPIRNYFIRRFFRIVPLFYIAIVFFTWVNGMGPSRWAPEGLSVWHLMSTFMFLHVWHPETVNSVVPGGWTIGVEMTFYLCIPFLFRWLTSIGRTVAFLLVALILARVSVFVFGYLYGELYAGTEGIRLVTLLYYFSFFSQLPVFGFGILAYHWFRRVEHVPNRDQGVVQLAVAIFLFFAFLGVQTMLGLLQPHIFYGAAFCVFAVGLYQYPSPLFVNPLITRIGKQSFSIYIVHFYLISLPQMSLNNTFEVHGKAGFVLVFAALLAFSFVISWFTYEFIEKPGIKLGNRLVDAMEEMDAKAEAMASSSTA